MSREHCFLDCYYKPVQRSAVSAAFDALVHENAKSASLSKNDGLKLPNQLVNKTAYQSYNLTTELSSETTKLAALAHSTLTQTSLLQLGLDQWVLWRFLPCFPDHVLVL